MMRNNHALLICIVCSVTVALFSCTYQTPVAGTITQSGNGVVSGMVIDSGLPVSGARVLIIPSEYDPVTDNPLPDSLIDTTSTTGNFSVTVPTNTRYNVEVLQGSGKTALYFGIDTKADDTQHVSPLNIAYPGCISVIVNDTTDLNSAHVYIPGTTIFSKIPENKALLTNVGLGLVPHVLIRSSIANTTRELSSNVSVNSNDTTKIADYFLWRYSRKIYLNTTVSGAGINGTITNFPTLIRLTRDNFPFNQTMPNGEDIRFSKENNSPLPFEIEEWNSASSTAEIWVKIDTIYGNDSSHCITMHWGNQNTTSLTNSESVFDTANGFLGVWHLGDNGTSNIADATSHHYNGIPSATAPSPVNGIINKAFHFDGIDNGVIMQETGNTPLNFTKEDSYTFSAWVKVDTVYGEDSFIAGKGHDQYSLRVKGSLSFPSNMLALHEYDDSRVVTDMRCLPAIISQWKYMTGVRNHDKMYLFIDGICVDSTGVVYDGKKTVLNNANFSIGRCAQPFNGDNYLPFKGTIDEVTISGVARSADWIKLCYMNQNTQDKLLQYDK